MTAQEDKAVPGRGVGGVGIRTQSAGATSFSLLVPQGSVWGPGQASRSTARDQGGELPAAQGTCPDISEEVLAATQG